jgi:hypothetical protein
MAVLLTSTSAGANSSVWAIGLGAPRRFGADAVPRHRGRCSMSNGCDVRDCQRAATARSTMSEGPPVRTAR